MEIHPTVADPNGVVHRWVFDFELAFFDRNKYQTVEQWMEQWWWLSIPYAFIYIVAIFIGQTWMKSTNRKYELRFWLVLWNTILAVFSLWGAWRAVPELFYSIDRYGFTYSICDPSYKKGITGLWSWLFMLSKVPETIDTLFIVLRRQPLIFLHWYHHASVLVYCFYSYAWFVSTGRWFVSMNYCVHTIMYGYFALRAAKLRLPRSLQKSITLLQLVQMIIGCMINLAALEQKRNGKACATSEMNIYISLMMYASYLILFAHFFYTTYFSADSSKKSKKHE